MSKVEGLDELLATLSGMGGELKEGCKQALERGAKRIQKNAKLLAPVKTGHLRNSIKTKSEITEDGAEAQVYTNCEYGVYTEFGTGQRGAESNIDRPDGVSYKADWKGMPAQPYMTPAFLHAKNTGEVEKEVVKSIQSQITKIANSKKKKGGK